MGHKLSSLPLATQMPANLIGNVPGLNQQVPLAVLTTYVTNLFNSLAMQTPAPFSFQGAWSAQTYYPGNIVTYASKVYCMIGTGPYNSLTRPDLDPTYWLCMFGQTTNATDMNNVVTNMEFFICNGGANAPSSSPYGYGFTFFNGTNIGIQIFFSSDSTQIWSRQTSDAVTWSDWNLLATTYPNVQNVGISGGNAWLSVATGSEFSLTVSAICNIGLGGWPVINNKVCRIRLEVINGGAFAVTWTNTTINWVKPNGTISQNFADLGLTLNTSGPNFFEFWSKDGGNTIYGRALLS